MSKFQVGDKVYGNEESDSAYIITNSTLILAEVTSIHTDGMMNIKALEFSDDCEYGKGAIYTVHEDYFDLVEEDDFCKDCPDYFECHGEEPEEKLPDFKYIALDKELNFELGRINSSVIKTVFNSITEVVEFGGVISSDLADEYEADEFTTHDSAIIAREDFEDMAIGFLGVEGLMLSEQVPSDCTAVKLAYVKNDKTGELLFADMLIVYEVTDFDIADLE